MGFGGVAPSIGIALDTYQNFNQADPAYDHISIQANGLTNHTNDLAGPVPISAAGDNVEDCQWHKLRISWDAGGQWLRTYFDGVLRVEKQLDLVNAIFNGDPAVYWGFTGATGGEVNLQQFCTALDPAFTTNVPDNATCEGGTITFTDGSESFAPVQSYSWLFGDGSSSNVMTPPPHLFARAGEYEVTLKIRAQDGCEAATTSKITVGSVPSAAFTIADTCFGNIPRLQLTAQNVGVAYQWKLDGVSGALNSLPALSGQSAGNHGLGLIVSSLYNCGPDAGASASFTIKPLPVAEAVVKDGCVGIESGFSGVQKDNATSISSWNWSFGDGQTAAGQVVRHSYNNTQQYTVKLSTMATNGCFSVPVTATVSINKALVFAGNDTILVRSRATPLQATGNGSFQWSPGTGLSDPTISNPLVTLNSDQQYTVTVTTPEGCTAEDRILIKVYNGPAVYAPTAFTPNGDGKNETFRPVYVGIKELKDLSIFNRWGQLLFRTHEKEKAWDGGSLSGTFVWFVEATDDSGRPVFLKGTVTVIR
jgi:gliding motility-associated-like protein